MAALNMRPRAGGETQGLWMASDASADRDSYPRMSVDESSTVALEDESGRAGTFVASEQRCRICEHLVETDLNHVNTRLELEHRWKRIRDTTRLSIETSLIGGKKLSVVRAANHRTEHSILSLLSEACCNAQVTNAATRSWSCRFALQGTVIR